MELMIALALGSMLIVSAVTLIGSSVTFNQKVLLKIRLQQELDAIAVLISREVRRAGYDGHSVALWILDQADTSPFSDSISISHFPSEMPDSCILFSYDENHNGVLDTDKGNELFGFRLKNGAIEIRRNGAECEKGGWEDLSDSRLIEINKLQFSSFIHENQRVSRHYINIELMASAKGFPRINKKIATSVLVRNHVQN